MPLFEYICKGCRKRFEALVYGSKQPQCPLCDSAELEQQISTFSVGTPRARAAAAGCGMAAADGGCGLPCGPAGCHK